MLGFFSNKPTHPLADAREAKRILAEIASRDPQGAVEEAIAWFESCGGADGFKPAQRLDLLLRLDEACTPQVRRLARDYPAGSAASRALEVRLWDLGHDYWGQLFTTYQFCLSGYRAGEKDADVIKPQLQLLYGRLVSAMGANLKWDQFHYGPINPDFWVNAGGIYLAAGEAKLAQKPLMLYPNQAETTIEAEYIKVLVFQSSSMDKLTPLQIEIGERLIAYFLPYFSLVREVRPENLYWVDAGKPLPPTRLAKVPEITPTLRFFSCARAVEAVGRTIEQLTKEHRVPPGINLGAQYEVDTVIPVLRHFEMCWALNPPIRSTARRRINSELKVVNGLAGIHRRLSGHANGVDVIETWLVEDVSLGGMGAQSNVSRNDWIRIKALVAIQPEGGDNWLLGVIRRYARKEPTRGSVGIETISTAPRAVLADSGGFMTEAILIDVPEVGEYARMVLAPNAVEEGVALLFSVDGKNARLHPRETLMTDPDYVVVNFFVQSYS
jgi:hypothetical protein